MLINVMLIKKNMYHKSRESVLLSMFAFVEILM